MLSVNSDGTKKMTPFDDRKIKNTKMSEEYQRYTAGICYQQECQDYSRDLHQLIWEKKLQKLIKMQAATLQGSRFLRIYQ